jgi:hypothetical protein
MGEQESLHSGEKLQLVDDKNVGDKLASFGRSLFNSGKDLVDKAGKEIQKVDLNKVAETAGKVVKDNPNLVNVASGALGFGFPQLNLISKGSSELGDVIARKQAKSLLDDPRKLSDKALTSFDEFDREKTGYLDDAKLRRFDGITGIASDNRAVAQILRSGYTTFNGLDGDASKKGISRKDIEILGLLQNRELLDEQVKKTAFDRGLAFGAVGAGAGAAAAYFSHAGLDISLAAAKSVPLGRIAAAAAIGAVAVGGIADLVSKHSQRKHYEEKGKEVNRMLESMKNSF